MQLFGRNNIMNCDLKNLQKPLRYKKNWNTQMMSMIIFYVFLAAKSESNIGFASSRLDLAVPKLWIFAFLLKSEKISSVSDLQL